MNDFYVEDEPVEEIRRLFDTATERGSTRAPCGYCGEPIHVMINQGTVWCSENCRKALAGE